MSTAEAAMANLADLTKLSIAINQKSNEVNQILQDLEKKLLTMNLGVEAWVPNFPLASVQETVTEENSYGDEYERLYSREEVLGFGLHGARYMLLVKEMHYSAQPAMGNEDWRLDREGRPRPLLQASRELRIAALERIERLIDALLAEAQKIISAIEKGRQTVDKL